MIYALIAVAALAIGFAAGYFFLKSRSMNLVLEKEILSRENEMLKGQINNQEAFKEESLKAAKAAVLEVSQTVSSKLIEDHKRENSEVKKQTEEMTRKTTETMMKEFTNVVEKLAAIQGQVQTHDKKVSSIWQALTSTGGAGQFAEIGLENTLKGFGLEKDKDFYMQYSVNYEGSRLRPDAVINLPEGNLMVIDAKSSKLFLEIAEGENNEEQLLQKLKATMNRHLDGLSSKDYQSAIRKDNKADNINVVNVMYLANQAALAKVHSADPDFIQKCFRKGILLADPTVLQLLLVVSTQQINRARQEHNYQLILKEMGKVVSSLDMFLRNIEAVGKAIRSSADNFEKLANSVNSRLITRVKRIVNLGVEPEKDVKIPDSISEFRVIENEPKFIDLEEEKPTLLGQKAS